MADDALCIISLFTYMKRVTITCPTEGAVIRYTVNGGDPTDSSTLYTSPVNLTAGQEIRARAFKNGYRASNVVRYVNEETVS